MTPAPRPLSAEDLSILALENETVAGHTCKVIVVAKPVGVEELRDRISSRLELAPELRMRLDEADGELCWTPDPNLDLGAHVLAADAADGPLSEIAARLFEQRLDRSRPLWRLDVASLSDGRCALIWRIHHALADGSTVMRIVETALFESADPGGGRRTGPARPAQPPDRQRLGRLRALARETPQPWLRSPFDGQITAERSVAFATVELQTLRQVAAAVEGATVNDAVLTVVAGGLRRWLESQHGRLGSLRVKVPVSLHDGVKDAGASEPGNRDSFFCLDLPLGSADPLERMAAIRRSTRTRKQGHDAQHIDSVMRQLARAPRLRGFAERALTHPRSFALNVSNVPGPRGSAVVLGAPVRALYSLAEIREHHALRVAVVSFGDTLNFGLCADPTLVSDVEALARGIEDEATAVCERLQAV